MKHDQQGLTGIISVSVANSSRTHLVVFHRLVQKNTSLLPAVCLVPAQGPEHLVIFIWLLVPQLDLQGADVWAAHVVPESHAVGRILRVNHGAQQPGNFAFLAFVSLRVNEVAISCCDRRTVLGIVAKCHFLCSPKKRQSQPPVLMLPPAKSHSWGWCSESSGEAHVLQGEFISVGHCLLCLPGWPVPRIAQERSQEHVQCDNVCCTSQWAPLKESQSSCSRLGRNPLGLLHTDCAKSYFNLCLVCVWEGKVRVEHWRIRYLWAAMVWDQEQKSKRRS